MPQWYKTDVWSVFDQFPSKKKEEFFFFNDALNTFLIYCYVVSDIW